MPCAAHQKKIEKRRMLYSIISMRIIYDTVILPLSGLRVKVKPCLSTVQNAIREYAP
jgi:hypothetical protein